MVAAKGKHRPNVRSAFYFDRNAADRACDFFPRYLRHIKGEWAGQPFELAEWQKREVIRPLFGWKRRSDGTRRYRMLYLEEGRKNGKSLLGGGIGLYLLECDEEMGAEIYSAAGDRSQAAIVFDLAAEMVRQSPSLLQRTEIYKRRLFVPDTLSFYQVLSADIGTKHGLNPHGIIFDELHVQDNRELWDVLQTGRGARRQPLTIAITTAGFERHSICREQHDRAIAVRDGVIQDDSLLPVIYGFEEGDNWEDRKVWKRCNPNLGISLKLSYLEEEFSKAKDSPAYENTFRRLHLCQWVEQAVRWINMDRWDTCAGELDYKDLATQLEGQPCKGGLDLSNVSDLAAFVLLFEKNIEPGEPDYPTEESVCGKKRTLVIPGFEYGDPIQVYDALCWFWCPEEGIRQRSRRDKVPYDIWAKEGWLIPTEGDAIDYEAIKLKIVELSGMYDIQEIGADPWNATQVLIQLEKDHGFNVLQVRQGFGTMNTPTKGLEVLYRRRGIRHAANPILRWNANNVSLDKDAHDNWKPSKEKSSEKIDGITALVTGYSRFMVDPEDKDYDRPIEGIG